jgi:hypothetical protein
VYAITVPAAVVMLVRDAIHDYRIHSTLRNRSRRSTRTPATPGYTITTVASMPHDKREVPDDLVSTAVSGQDVETSTDVSLLYEGRGASSSSARMDDSHIDPRKMTPAPRTTPPSYPPTNDLSTKAQPVRSNLSSLIQDWLRLSTDTFPTVTSVIARLPFALLPFAFSMFILVQGLDSQGWVETFTKWWTVWVDKTGSIGAVAGMGLLSVCLSNVGTVLQSYPSRLSIDRHTWHAVCWDKYRRSNSAVSCPTVMGCCGEAYHPNARWSGMRLHSSTSEVGLSVSSRLLTG